MLRVRLLTAVLVQNDVEIANLGGLFALWFDLPGLFGRASLLRLPEHAASHSALLRKLQGVPTSGWSGALNHTADLVQHPGAAMLTGRPREVGKRASMRQSSSAPPSAL